MSGLKILRGKKGKILTAIMNAIIPRGGAYGPGAADYDLLPRAEAFILAMNPLFRMGIPYLLRYIEYSSLISTGTRFTRLTEEAASAYMEGFDESRLYYKRGIVLALKMIAMLAFYDIDENAELIGYRHWRTVDRDGTGKRRGAGAKPKSKAAHPGKNKRRK
jgi:hypothetical protein